MTLGKILCLLRSMHGYTQKEVAEHLGLCASQYHCIEAGKRTLCVDNLDRCAQLFEMRGSQLLALIEKVDGNSSLRDFLTTYLDVTSSNNIIDNPEV